MRSFRTFFSALALVALAACGGGSGGGTVPPAASDPGTRDPSGSSIVFERATLWVAYDAVIHAYSTDGNGAVTPKETLPRFMWPTPKGVDNPGITDIAIAPDGTQYVLENRDFALGGRGWRLFTVAPGETEPEHVNGDDVSRPFAVGIAGDGIMVGLYGPNGETTIATFPYGASNAPPIRTFTSTSRMLAFAEGNDSKLYVARPNGVDVYLPTSDGSSPLRSIATGALPSHVTIGPHEFAVGPNNSIYVVDLPGNHTNPVMYVNVYAPRSGALVRRIGPLPADYGGFGFPVITVDAKNRLYVATNGHIYRFGPTANGTAAPQRDMIDPAFGRARALAIGPKL